MSNMSIDDAIKNSKSKSDVYRIMGWPINGASGRRLKIYIEDNNVSIDHFEKGFANRKHFEIEKICPICDKKFKTTSNVKKEVLHVPTHVQINISK